MQIGLPARRLALAVVGLLIGVSVIVISQTESGTLDFWTYRQAISSTVSAVLVVIGFLRWRRSRLAAYRWFSRALLASIFVTQFFAFYHNQITQVSGLAIALATYAAVSSLQSYEQSRSSRSSHRCRLSSPSAGSLRLPPRPHTGRAP